MTVPEDEFLLAESVVENAFDPESTKAKLLLAVADDDFGEMIELLRISSAVDLVFIANDVVLVVVVEERGIPYE